MHAPAFGTESADAAAIAPQAMRVLMCFIVIAKLIVSVVINNQSGALVLLRVRAC